ncbi:MAG: hypothetical protein ACRCZO_04665 [Cetobacterium sp.]
MDQKWDYSKMSLKELLCELKKNEKNKELLKIVKNEMSLKSNYKQRIEKILDTMESVDFYVGFKNEIIERYFNEIRIFDNDIMPSSVREEAFIYLKRSDKVKYIKRLLHHEMEKIQKVRNSKNEKLKEKMMKEKKYRVLDMILEMEEKESTTNS